MTCISFELHIVVESSAMQELRSPIEAAWFSTDEVHRASICISGSSISDCKLAVVGPSSSSSSDCVLNTAVSYKTSCD